MKRIDIDFRQPQVMAIVNVTEDSFYAKSRMAGAEAVRERVRQALAEGATIIDVGGYSSRPGAADVPLAEEWERVDMALAAIREVDAEVAISIDTFRAEVVRRAVAGYGPVIVNDITAGEGDADMVPTVASLDVPYVAMHMRGTPQTMQHLTDYEDATGEVCAYLRDRAQELERAGVRPENIILDPGFGFAKSTEQCYKLLGELNYLCALDYPVLVGVSRKSMIYRLLDTTPEQALCGTQVVHWEALRQGATLLRVHDVREAVQTIRMFEMFKSQLTETEDD